MQNFNSDFKIIGELKPPIYTGLKTINMPIDFQRPDLIPRHLVYLEGFIKAMISLSRVTSGIGYLSIHEKFTLAYNNQMQEGIRCDKEVNQSNDDKYILFTNVKGIKIFTGKFTGENKGSSHEYFSMKQGIVKNAEQVITEPYKVYLMNIDSFYEEVKLDYSFKRQIIKLLLPPKDGFKPVVYTENPWIQFDVVKK